MEVRLLVPELLGYMRTQARQSKQVSETFLCEQANKRTHYHSKALVKL